MLHRSPHAPNSSGPQTSFLHRDSRPIKPLAPPLPCPLRCRRPWVKWSCLAGRHNDISPFPCRLEPRLSELMFSDACCIHDGDGNSGDRLSGSRSSRSLAMRYRAMVRQVHGARLLWNVRDQRVLPASPFGENLCANGGVAHWSWQKLC